MIESLPEWVYTFLAVLIAVVVAVALVVVVIAILKSKKLTIGKATIDMSGRQALPFPGAHPDMVGASDADAICKAQVLERRLEVFFDLFRQRVLTFMKHTLKIDADKLASNSDYMFAMSLAKFAIYGKNGRQSARTIVEDAIKNGIYVLPEGEEVDRIKYRQSVMRGLIQEIEAQGSQVLNSDYKNEYTTQIEQGGKWVAVEYSRRFTIEMLASLFREFAKDTLSPEIEGILFPDHSNGCGED